MPSRTIFSMRIAALIALAGGMLTARIAAQAPSTSGAFPCGQTRMPVVLARFLNQVEVTPPRSADPLGDQIDETLTAAKIGQCHDLADQVWLIWAVDIAHRMSLDWNGNDRAGPSLADLDDEKARFSKLLAQPLPPAVRAEAVRGLSFVGQTEALARGLGVPASKLSPGLHATGETADQSQNLVAQCRSVLAGGTSNREQHKICIDVLNVHIVQAKKMPELEDVCMSRISTDKQAAAIVNWLSRHPKAGENQEDGVARAMEALWHCPADNH